MYGVVVVVVVVVVVIVVVEVVVVNETTSGESTIGVNHVRSLLVVSLPALLLCHELQLGIAGQARGRFVADLLRLWHKMVSALFIAWLLGTRRARWEVHQLLTLRVGNGRLNDVLSPGALVAS